jgi:lysylphosphatidylglycerol synthetase-like protein (DUF2156 family)
MLQRPAQYPAASDFRQIGSDDAERAADLLAKRCHCSDANHCNQADKHAVFDKSGALFFTTEAFDELKHAKYP